MKHAAFFTALLTAAGLTVSAANAAPPALAPQSAAQFTNGAASGTSAPTTSGSLNRQAGSAMNFASPDYVPPPPGLSGSPGTTPNGGNNAQAPNGNNNAKNPTGNNNAQAPNGNGNDNVQSPNGGTNAPNPGGSSPSAVPTTIN